MECDPCEKQLQQLNTSRIRLYWLSGISLNMPSVLRPVTGQFRHKIGTAGSLWAPHD